MANKGVAVNLLRSVTTVWKAQPASYTIPTSCCVTSALFEYSTGNSIMLTGVGHDHAATCDDDQGTCQASCGPGLTGGLVLPGLTKERLIVRVHLVLEWAGAVAKVIGKSPS